MTLSSLQSAMTPPEMLSALRAEHLKLRQAASVLSCLIHAARHDAQIEEIDMSSAAEVAQRLIEEALSGLAALSLGLQAQMRDPTEAKPAATP